MSGARVDGGCTCRPARLVDGRPVRVFDAHLAERRQEPFRAKQTAVLAEAVARYDRTIVLGDFGAVPDTAELAGMWDPAAAADADRACGPSAAGGCEPTTDWRGKFGYVFLRGFAPLGQDAHPTPHSDHDLVKPVRGARGGLRRRRAAWSTG